MSVLIPNSNNLKNQVCFHRVQHLALLEWTVSPNLASVYFWKIMIDVLQIFFSRNLPAQFIIYFFSSFYPPFLYFWTIVLFIQSFLAIITLVFSFYCHFYFSQLLILDLWVNCLILVCLMPKILRPHLYFPFLFITKENLRHLLYLLIQMLFLISNLTLSPHSLLPQTLTSHNLAHQTNGHFQEHPIDSSSPSFVFLHQRFRMRQRTSLFCLIGGLLFLNLFLTFKKWNF